MPEFDHLLVSVTFVIFDDRHRPGGFRDGGCEMDNFKYEVDKNQVTITRHKRLGTDEDVVIPDTIDGRPVVAIGVSAFGRTKLTSITLPNSITSIGSYAFRECFKLTSITLPNSVTTIGDWAFARCHSLTSISVPDGCSIGEGAFEDCPAAITIRDKEDE
jgi:hypothetical protein